METSRFLGVVEPFRLIGRKLEEKAAKIKYFSNLAHYSHTGLPVYQVSEIFILWLVLGWKRS